MNRIVIVNPVWDRRDTAPEAVLTRFSTLTGWAGAIRGKAPTHVDVVQQFNRDERIEKDGVTYRFVAGRSDSAAASLDGDLLHVNGFDRPRLLRRLRRAAPKTPIAAQDHGGFDPQRLSPARRAWMRYGLAAVDVLLVATPPQAESFRASGVVPDRTAIRDVMESSTDIRALRRERAPDAALTILWVGRLNAIKDPVTVLDGFSRFAARRPDARLTFVYGDRTLEADLRARLDADPSLTARVRLAGHVEHDDLPAMYGAADLFVLGSHREGSGYAALEAMACGVVPVLTDIPPFRWLTDAGRLGAIWKVGDAASLAAAFERAAASDLQQQSDACREAFERQWSWDAIGERARAIYREFCRI